MRSRTGGTTEEALARLPEISQREHTKLAEVAQDVVDQPQRSKLIWHVLPAAGAGLATYWLIRSSSALSRHASQMPRSGPTGFAARLVPGGADPSQLGQRARSGTAGPGGTTLTYVVDSVLPLD